MRAAKSPCHRCAMPGLSFRLAGRLGSSSTRARCRKLGIGTAGDHHVHHRTFTSNYGHIFMYWDYLFGTYKSPLDVSLFRKDI